MKRDSESILIRVCTIGIATVLLVLLLVVLASMQGCVSVDEDGDWDIDIDARDVTDVMDGASNLFRGPAPEVTITMPRKGAGYRVAATITITSDDPPGRVEQVTTTGKSGSASGVVVGSSVPGYRSYPPQPTR